MFIVKVPGINSENGETKGCRNAGNDVLNELKKIEVNEEGKIIDIKLLDLEEIHLTNSNLWKDAELIYENSLEIFGTKPKVVFLGGDHSVSYNLVKSFFDIFKKHNEGTCLIVFDAHADCENVEDEKFPGNRQWLKNLVDKGFPAENILFVGLRNLKKEEEFFIKQNNIKRIRLNQLKEDLRDSCDAIMEFSQGRNLYVSIDISVLDPVFAPGTKGKETGGLTSRELIYLVQRINKMKNLKAVDIVEINSDKDKDYENLTVRTGAKILSELI